MIETTSLDYKNADFLMDIPHCISEILVLANKDTPTDREQAIKIAKATYSTVLLFTHGLKQEMPQISDDEHVRIAIRTDWKFFASESEGSNYTHAEV
jgi:hypothetical protein